MHPLSPHICEFLSLDNVVVIPIEDAENHIREMLREFYAGHYIRNVPHSFG